MPDTPILTESLMTADEAAQLLHVPRSTLYELVRSHAVSPTSELEGGASDSLGRIWLDGSGRTASARSVVPRTPIPRRRRPLQYQSKSTSRSGPCLSTRPEGISILQLGGSSSAFRSRRPDIEQ